MIIAAMLALAATTTAPAPATVDDDGVMVRARVDPIVFAVAGASVSVDVGRDADAWRLTGTAFVVDIPRPLVPFVVDGPASLKITESVLQLGAMWSASPGHQGFYIGPELFFYALRTVDEAVPQRHATSAEVYAHVTAGTVYFPWRSDGVDIDVTDDGVLSAIFFQPIVTAGVPVFGAGDAVFADGTVIADRLFNWHATVSVGLELW